MPTFIVQLYHDSRPRHDNVTYHVIESATADTALAEVKAVRALKRQDDVSQIAIFGIGELLARSGLTTTTEWVDGL